MRIQIFSERFAEILKTLSFPAIGPIRLFAETFLTKNCQKDFLVSYWNEVVEWFVGNGSHALNDRN